METDLSFAGLSPEAQGAQGDRPTPISLGRPAMTLIPAPEAAGPDRCFSWWKETGMDGRTVRYLIRDEHGNHVATCGAEHQAQDLIDLLNFAVRAEAGIDDFEAPLTGLREDLHEARVAGKGRVAIGRMNVRLDDIWESIGRIRGAV